MRTPVVVATAALFALASRPAPSAAQAIPERRLTHPDAVFPEPFSLIRGLRELADGRVLITDWIDERVAVVDFGRGTATTIGRTGRGPAEYRLPSRLIALPGDTTLLIDEGNQRLTLIGPDLNIGAALGRPADVDYPFGPSVADARGILYFTIPGWAVGAAPGDSVAIARWDRAAGTATTVARIRGSTPPSRRDGRTMGIPLVMFAPQDAWSVAPDGTLLLLRSLDYHLERKSAGGSRSGQSNAYPTRVVTDADQTWFVRRFLATSPMSGRGADGGMGHTPSEMQTAEAVARIVRTNEFAERLPFFAAGGIWPLPDRTLLVQRTSGADPRVALDRLSADGRVIERVVLPEHRMVIGIGRGALYLALVDGDGLQTLERYRL
jgi:hypothetical protein